MIATAITPVALISAAAILISSIHQKHQAMSDRLRSLAAEYRTPGLPEWRVDAIRGQAALFRRRIACVALAHVALYAAVVCFVAMVLVLTLSTRTGLWDGLALGLLVVGAALILAAVSLEVVELAMAGRTLQLDVQDLLEPKAPRED